ncbi:MAG: HAMP domain-containing histidine kinase [Planctomycetes bacterium]|nr:HAMP domain-containing histidine kinase [Planctomycetota bacterium]
MDTPLDMPGILRRLLENPESLDGQERLAAARAVAESLQGGTECDETVLAALRILAEDTKWEVRKVVADTLAHLGDDNLAALAARLSQDVNFFVKRAAERSLDRRRRMQRETGRKERALKQCGDRLDQMRRRYGDAAASAAAQVGQQQAELLLGTIAHDIRSVLTPLKASAAGLSQVVAENGHSEVLQRKAKAVLDAVDFMERCVSDIESYSSPLPLERHPEDVAAVLAAARDMAMQNLQELGLDTSAVDFSMEVPDGVRVGMARHLITLALANLLRNAYESFMMGPEQLRAGQVVVKVESEPVEVRIIIRDTGMGMQAEDLAELRVFIPARRNKAKPRSTGFGLPIANRYIAAHGGTLTVESTEGQGTVVTVTLPRQPTGNDEVQ